MKHTIWVNSQVHATEWQRIIYPTVKCQVKINRMCGIIIQLIITISKFSKLIAGLLIFRTVAEPRNSGKSWKSREIHKNTKNAAKFGRNLIKYMSVQHIWNSFQLLALFACHELANLSWNFVKKCENNVPSTRCSLCWEKLGTSPDVKGLPWVHFWSVLLLKEQMMTSVRKTIKTLVWSAQIRLPLHRYPILSITHMITDQIGLHSVLLPLLSGEIIAAKYHGEIVGIL